MGNLAIGQMTKSSKMKRTSAMSDEPIGLGRLDTLLGYHLRRASLVFYPDFRLTGFRRGLIGILSVVEANPGINQITLSRTLKIDTGNLVPLIDDLVGRGLLKRNVHPKDRRSSSLSVTRAGRAELNYTVKRAVEQESSRLAGLSEQERGILMSLLRRIHRQGF
jgi:DNA-binding MarR family transcriptional regulator